MEEAMLAIEAGWGPAHAARCAHGPLEGGRGCVQKGGRKHNEQEL